MIPNHIHGLSDALNVHFMNSIHIQDTTHSLEDGIIFCQTNTHTHTHSETTEKEKQTKRCHKQINNKLTVGSLNG